MANLKPLIKLRKYNVEEKQKVLATLLREVEKYEAKKLELNLQIKRERQIAEEREDYETQAAFRLYAERAREWIRMYDIEIRKLNVLIARAQEEMREAFSEMKKIEIIQKEREEEERRAANAKDSARMDEVGITGFLRKEDES
jgi:flagellar protein FliJ